MMRKRSQYSIKIDNRYQYSLYHERIKRNITTISAFISQPVDNDLYKLFTRYKCSFGNKLLSLLDYFEHYEMQLSYHPIRGFEMACSLDCMISRAGGGKQTWKNAITTLCMLGLLQQFKPKFGERGILLNSPAQACSVARADSKKRYPVTWYRVPEYTEEVLDKANELAAKALQYGSGIDKDGIRYELGATAANQICDTGYPKAEWRKAMEKAILSAIDEQLRANGYANLKGVLRASQGLTGYDESRILSTWKSYRHQLHSEIGICYGRPTAQQKSMFNLKNEEWIITKMETHGEIT